MVSQSKEDISDSKVQGSLPWQPKAKIGNKFTKMVITSVTCDISMISMQSLVLR